MHFKDSKITFLCVSLSVRNMAGTVEMQISHEELRWFIFDSSQRFSLLSDHTMSLHPSKLILPLENWIFPIHMSSFNLSRHAWKVPGSYCFRSEAITDSFQIHRSLVWHAEINLEVGRGSSLHLLAILIFEGKLLEEGRCTVTHTLNSCLRLGVCWLRKMLSRHPLSVLCWRADHDGM